MNARLGMLFLVTLTGCTGGSCTPTDRATDNPTSAANSTSSEASPPTTVLAALENANAQAVADAAEKMRSEGKTEELIPLLIKGLSNDNVDVRETCSEQLVQIAPDNQAAIRALILSIQDQDPVVRLHAAQALGEIGPPAKEAVDALDQLEKNPTEQDDVRKAAGHALQIINQVPTQ